MQLEQIIKEISKLPIGSIAVKKIKDKTYYYHRWYENGKRKEKYLSVDEAERMKLLIEKRKEMERKVKELHTSRSKQGNKEVLFYTSIIRGSALDGFIEKVKNYKKRECYQEIKDFVYGEAVDKVFILYGLRRTGKTTLIRQIIADMTIAERSLAAFIQITAKNTLADVNKDLKTLQGLGYKYIFIDEVTLMEDFIEGAALFSDIFAACGMKIVLSGTDSLGFLFTKDEQLYDRCIMLHTTFIPYREFEKVLNISGIDEYIRYGGTMSLSGVNYNQTSPFANKKSADEYVDTAIARNIQHSLRCYQYEGHFRNLQDLYVKNELTSAINRVVEDINHRFTLEVLTRNFSSNDLALSANNLRRDKELRIELSEHADINSVTEKLCQLLEIRNQNEQTVKISELHSEEIKEYLHLLDMTQEIPIVSMPNIGEHKIRTVIAQPGIRYAQAKALIESLLQDSKFNELSLIERTVISERILNEIKGRMLEDIVLLETMLAHKEKKVFVLQFAIGEFDMVVFNPQELCCEIYEIKHSTQVDSKQYRHLVDAEKCAATEHRYGKIKAKYVLYRGESTQVGEVQYQNVEEYLKHLA